MGLHRELFTDLPPAEDLRKMFAGSFAQWNNADGFYILVQYIAEQYGDRAYELAEEVFKEMGLDYDPAVLRTPDAVRRIDYNFAGSNIYDLQVKAFSPDMTAEIVRLYNEQIRKVSYEALMDGAYFAEHIQGRGVLLAACSQGGQPIGFVHCLEEDGRTSVEMLIVSHGRIYDAARKALVKAAREFCAGRSLELLTGRIAYPFYAAVPSQREAALEKSSPQIVRALQEIGA
jgi:hypothetical protein